MYNWNKQAVSGCHEFIEPASAAFVCVEHVVTEIKSIYIYICLYSLMPPIIGNCLRSRQKTLKSVVKCCNEKSLAGALRSGEQEQSEI